MSQQIAPPKLHWEARDIERRLGFKGAKYTGTNTFLTTTIGLILAIAFYAALAPFEMLNVRAKAKQAPQAKTAPEADAQPAEETQAGIKYYFATMFFERGPIPYVIVLFAAWCVAVLFVKSRKLKLQQESLDHSILPEEPDFVLSPITANDILGNLYRLADNPKHFLLLNRIERALSNLKNIGRISDIDDILRSQADNDEAYTESTYTAVRGFIWAIPVLGFIGTVLGLSDAIGGFGAVLSKSTEITQLRGALQDVTGGLSVAFETTLIGLVAAVCIQLLLTSLKRREELFLDQCNEYCHWHIVSKLRTIPVEEDQQVEGAP